MSGYPYGSGIKLQLAYGVGLAIRFVTANDF
jgi:hypothetical protein